MTCLAAIGLLCALLQDKTPVTITPDAPTESVWPISGRCTRPNGTVVKVSAVRIERRWDPVAERFRESNAETRIMRSAEVDGRSFRANLKFGPTGVYDVSVNESEQKLATERHVLGHPIALFGATRKSLAKLTDLCDRAIVNLEEIQRVQAGKQPGGAREREAFIKRVHADEQAIQELLTRIDLTGSANLLLEICVQIRNAQVWELRAGSSTEQQNDGEGAGKDVFLDPKLTYKGLRAMIASVQVVLSKEMVLSSATILDAMYQRAEGRPEKAFTKARDVALEAMSLLESAPVEDKDAKAVLQAAAGADSAKIAEVRKSLQELAAKYRAD